MAVGELRVRVLFLVPLPGIYGSCAPVSGSNVGVSAVQSAAFFLHSMFTVLSAVATQEIMTDVPANARTVSVALVTISVDRMRLQSLWIECGYNLCG